MSSGAALIPAENGLNLTLTGLSLQHSVFSVDGVAFTLSEKGTEGVVVQSGEPIWEIIRHARGGHGYSQREFAEELAVVSGISSVTRDDVKRWENGKRIPRSLWRHWISMVLDIPAEQLDIAARIAHRLRHDMN